MPFSRPRFIAAAAVVSLPLLTFDATAAERFVTVDGSDDASGSQDAPWLTLQHAADQVGPGDTVHVSAGTYVGFRVQTSGTSSAPIVFSADPGVVIDQPNSDGDGVRLQNVSHVTIEGFRIEEVPQYGVAHRGATADNPVVGLVLRNNTIASTGHIGMYISQVSQSLVEGNTIVDAGTLRPEGRHGIYLSNAGSDGTHLIANTISDCFTGIHFNGDLSIGGDGIMSDLVVRNNVLFDNTSNGLNMDGVQDSLIENNVVYSNGGNGLRAFQIDGAEGPKGLLILNNTFTDNTGWGLRISDEGGGIVIANNLFGGGAGLAFKESPSDLVSNHNGVAGGFSIDGDTILSLEQWQALGYGSESFVFDAATTFAADSYALLATAQAVDAGIAAIGGAQAPTTDVVGVARPFGDGVDVGAYEYCVGDCGGGAGGDATGGAGAEGGAGGADGGGDDGIGGDESSAGGNTGHGGNATGGSASDGGCSVTNSPNAEWNGLWLLALVAALRHRRDRYATN